LKQKIADMKRNEKGSAQSYAKQIQDLKDEVVKAKTTRDEKEKIYLDKEKVLFAPLPYPLDRKHLDLQN
jgi:hypothetical protein